MAHVGIVREPTKDEKTDFQPLQSTGGKVRTPIDVLKSEIAKNEQKAIKEGKPFAAKAVLDEYKDRLESWEKEWKRQGYADKKAPSLKDIDWDKFSNLKNFELIEEDEKYDEHLSKRHHLQVYVKWKKYKFKGYSNTYRVMENPHLAVERAREKLNPVKSKK